MTSKHHSSPILFGASVRGPRHISMGQPNQDAWLKAQGGFGSLAVVCDGLGSRPESSFGSRQACRAVRNAIGHWPGISNGAEVHDLIRLIEGMWRFSLSPHIAEDCASTCQFVLREPDGTLVAAGLGDGALLVKGQGDSVKYLGGRDGADFTNETLALGVPHRLGDWWFDVLPPCCARTVVLATDGVADDLHPGHLDGFVHWLTEDVAPLPALQRWRQLQSELRHWPVPHHTDDKTLVVMMETEQESS